LCYNLEAKIVCLCRWVVTFSNEYALTAQKHYTISREGEKLENYTKYQLKKSDELVSLLDGKDNLFVIACNKCFKAFETLEEPECREFEKIALEQGKTIKGFANVDFLCNKTLTVKKLEDMIPTDAENVIVISCGLGVQTVADLADIPAYSATNTLNYTGHHGMALTKKACDACAQCYLSMTGGICPIVDCSKSLVNGQCGGAKNGKCEVDPNNDCAWILIYNKLKEQGALNKMEVTHEDKDNSVHLWPLHVNTREVKK